MRKKNSISQQKKNWKLTGQIAGPSINVTSSTGYSQSGTFSSYSQPPFGDKIFNHSKVEKKDSGDKIIIFLNAALDQVLATCNLTQNKVEQLKVSRGKLVEYCGDKELKECLEVITGEDL